MQDYWDYITSNTMKLILPAAIERKLNAYVHAVKGEIAGMGKIEMREDGNFWVTEIAIYDQEVTGGTADLSSEALARFQTDLVKKGESPKNWILWWHSHSDFGAFFSKTDTDTIERSTEFNHFISLVVNKRQQREARLDIHRADGMPLRIFMELDVEVQPEVNERIIEIDNLIKELEDQKLEIEYAIPEGLVEEVAAKVKEKAWIGFGSHKGKGEKKWLTSPYEENWSNNRKKDGGAIIKTTKQAALHLTDYEIIEELDHTEQMIKAHEANGNADTVECEILRENFGTLSNEWEARVATSITRYEDDAYEMDEDGNRTKTISINYGDDERD